MAALDFIKGSELSMEIASQLFANKGEPTFKKSSGQFSMSFMSPRIRNSGTYSLKL